MRLKTKEKNQNSLFQFLLFGGASGHNISIDLNPKHHLSTYFLHFLLPFWWFYSKFQLTFLLYKSPVDSSPRLVWLCRLHFFVKCGQSNYFFSSNVNYHFFKSYIFDQTLDSAFCQSALYFWPILFGLFYIWPFRYRNNTYLTFFVFGSIPLRVRLTFLE